jgi:hypothetical protein
MHTQSLSPFAMKYERAKLAEGSRRSHISMGGGGGEEGSAGRSCRHRKQVGREEIRAVGREVSSMS